MEIDTLFAAESYAAGRGDGRARGGHAAYIVVIIVLTLVGAGLGAAYLQSQGEAQDWAQAAERRSSELRVTEQQQEEVARRLAESEAELVTTRESLATTTAKLQEASAQVKSLTDEKAKMLDKGTFIPAALAMQDELVKELNACIAHAQGLLSSLGQEGVEPAVVQARATDVEGTCDRAKADSAAFHIWLGTQ